MEDVSVPGDGHGGEWVAEEVAGESEGAEAVALGCSGLVDDLLGRRADRGPTGGQPGR
jgi:hypothetical protein